MNAGIRLTTEPLLNAIARKNIDIETEVPFPMQNAIRLARHKGFFTLAKADEIACNLLKMHPVTIWGEEYEAKVWHDFDNDIDVSEAGDKTRHTRPEVLEARAIEAAASLRSLSVVA